MIIWRDIKNRLINRWGDWLKDLGVKNAKIFKWNDKNRCQKWMEESAFIVWLIHKVTYNWIGSTELDRLEDK